MSFQPAAGCGILKYISGRFGDVSKAFHEEVDHCRLKDKLAAIAKDKFVLFCAIFLMLYVN